MALTLTDLSFYGSSIPLVSFYSTVSISYIQSIPYLPCRIKQKKHLKLFSLFNKNTLDTVKIGDWMMPRVLQILKITALCVLALIVVLFVVWALMSTGKIRTYSEPNSLSEKFVMDVGGAPNGFFIGN